MKYIVCFVFYLIIFCLCLLIWIITWEWDANKNGWALIERGLDDMFDVD